MGAPDNPGDMLVLTNAMTALRISDSDSTLIPGNWDGVSAEAKPVLITSDSRQFMDNRYFMIA